MEWNLIHCQILNKKGYNHEHAINYISKMYVYNKKYVVDSHNISLQRTVSKAERLNTKSAQNRPN